MAVPNVSCGSDADLVRAIGGEYERHGAVLLNTHIDPDHDRCVHTLAGRPGELAGAVAAGAAYAVSEIDLRRNRGVHPHVGVVDVAPIVHLQEGQRGAACAEALVLTDLLGRSGISVITYGQLAQGRTRADVRRGGLAALIERIGAGEQRVDFGPAIPTVETGVSLVAARSVMVAFNLVMAAGVTVTQASGIAADVRENGRDGLPGVRALGFEIESQGVVQVSANLERPEEAGIRELHERVSNSAPVSHGELIGLAPRAVLEAVPAELSIPGLDRERQSIEGCLRLHGIEI